MLRPRRRTLLASTASGFVTAALVFTLVAGANVALGSPAQAATPASSAVTVTAAEQDRDLTHAPMPDLAVTVSQTENLVAQGVRVSWTGGKKSVVSSVSSGGENFLQIFMCWGDDPTDSSRPDRTTCQYGAPGNIGASRDAYRASGTALADVPKEDQAYTAPGLASFLPPYTAIPFVARDGKRVDAIKTDPDYVATAAVSYAFSAWSSIDNANRILAGEKPVKTRTAVRVIDASNSSAVPAGQYYGGDVDFREHYKKLWGK